LSFWLGRTQWKTDRVHAEDHWRSKGGLGLASPGRQFKGMALG